MITPDAMELVSFVVLKERADAVADRLLALGVFHPVDIRGVENALSGLSLFQIEKHSADWQQAQQRVRDIGRRLNLSIQARYDRPLPAVDPQGIEQRLAAVDKETEALYRQKEEIAGRLQTSRSILAQVRDYLPFAVRRNALYSFLQVSTGRIEEKNVSVLERSLKDIPHVLYPFKKEAGGAVLAMLIALRRDRILVDKVLHDVAWQDVEYPADQGLSAAAQEKIQAQILADESALADADMAVRQLGHRYADDLTGLYSLALLKRSVLEAQRNCLTTDKTALFCGWVPRQDKEKLIREIRETAGASYLESRSAEASGVAKEDVPVHFNHGPLLKPFDMLIEAYGMPRYGSIDPTVFVAVSFLIMFGAMFGDIGHGLVLVLVGLLMAVPSFNRLLRPFTRSERVPEAGRRFGTLMLYCGISSTLFGVLYGSAFGFEFHSLWIKPMEQIMEAFKYGVYFGIGMISLGIVINVANALFDRNYAKAFFDKAGLIGGVIYWAAIGLVSKVFFTHDDGTGMYIVVVCAGVAVLFLYPIVESLFLRRHGVGEAFIESMINILEIFMGYLSNTVSFIRVAAFALAHAGLFLAIFSLSRASAAQPGVGTILSWLVILGGNILVVCLEGLVVSIQSVRLNYYEFFSKFFVAGKQVYKPLSLAQ